MQTGILVLVLSLAAVAATSPAAGSPRLASDYGVFCVHGRLAVDPRRIDQALIERGSEVRKVAVIEQVLVDLAQYPHAVDVALIRHLG